MKNSILIFISMFVSSSFAQPNIETRAGLTGYLQLGNEVTQALNKFNSQFKIYELTDFADGTGDAYLSALVEKNTGDCEQRTPPAVKALPQAVIGDFNGDGKDDAVVMGKDGREHMVLGVISSPKAYRVVVIEKSARMSGKLSTALSLVESTGKAAIIDYYVKCLPPSVKRFKNDGILVGEVNTNSQRLYSFNGSAFIKY